MNNSFMAAAALTVATGLVHTVMGEILIFRRLRRGSFVPAFGGALLRERHVRILWASWHALTLMAWSMAAVLIAMATAPASEVTLVIARWVSVGMAAGALAVLVGTRGRHPGWLAMLAVATLTELGR